MRRRISAATRMPSITASFGVSSPIRWTSGQDNRMTPASCISDRSAVTSESGAAEGSAPSKAPLPVVAKERRMPEIMTVLGPIAPKELGFTSMHEHVLYDGECFRRRFGSLIPPGPPVKVDDPGRLDN